jgi:glycosyltransferase involved in cell wall biosynthesis
MRAASVARKRVLHLIESGGIYGAERVIVNLSREMARHGVFQPVVGCITQRKDESVDLLTLSQSLGIEAHPVRVSNLGLPWQLPRAARELKRLGIDLIHCHGYKPTVFASVIGALTGIPVMATCHLWFVDANAPLKMRLMIGVEKRRYPHFPAVVAVSEEIRSILLGAGVKPGNVALIRNGIALEDYERPADLPARSAESEFCIVNIARLTAQKAQRDLVSAAVEMKRRGARFRILLAGEGELRQELTRQIEEQGVADVVQVLGFLSDVNGLLQRADLFALPSLDEGMPISLLEAVAARVPALVTAVGDIPKLIRDGETGTVVRPGEPLQLADALLALMADAPRRQRQADAAYQRLKEAYSATHMYEQYESVYRSVLSRN